MKKVFRNLAVLSLITTALIIGINKLIVVLSEMNDDLPIGSGKYYLWKYGSVYYTKTGKGSPVLLVHDLDVTSSSYEWSKTIHKLSKTNTVYAIDLLGCGRSEKPNITYSNYLYVQLISDFIKNVIGERTSIVATGDSFSFSLMTCQMHQDLVDKLIGVTPSDLLDLAKTPSKRKNILKGILEIPVIGTMAYNMYTAHHRITNSVTNYYFYKSHLASPEVVRAYYKAAHNGDGYGRYLLASIKSRYTNINIAPALKKVNNSICLIGGKEHPYIDEIIKEYMEYNPAIESAYIPATLCLPQLESPDKFVELLNILLETK